MFVFSAQSLRKSDSQLSIHLVVFHPKVKTCYTIHILSGVLLNINISLKYALMYCKIIYNLQNKSTKTTTKTRTSIPKHLEIKLLEK